MVIEDCFCYPDKWRRTVRRDSNNKESMLFVVNGDKHWARSAGKKVQEMPLPRANMRKPAILAILDQLAGLQESQQEIVVGAEEKVAGKILIPLTVTAGHRQSTTYFDRATGLIAKEIKNYLPDVHSPPETWKNERRVESETTYGDYKDFDGVTLPTRMVVSQAGKAVLDISVVQVEFPATFDAHAFDKPEDE